jgi:small subunit ribosomal protein S20
LVKTSVTKAERLIFSGELESARRAVIAAISSLDKAAEKGVIHPNNAARRKSRLMKKLNEALSSAEEAE